MLHERAMCVDALPAVKEIVHEKKEMSLAELGASCIPLHEMIMVLVNRLAVV